MEDKLRTIDYEFQTDWGKAWARGQAEGEAKALLRVLAARGVPLSQDDRDKITACTDASTLETWLDRAVTATTMADVFG
jgi:hypothetical protein